jgi:hypothetical protein
MKETIIIFLLLGLTFAGLFGGLSLIMQQTMIQDNTVVVGVFESLSVDKSVVTLYFSNATVNGQNQDPHFKSVIFNYYSISYYQNTEDGGSLQVPFIVGHTYQCVFGKAPASINPVLQTVVEIPT